MFSLFISRIPDKTQFARCSAPLPVRGAGAPACSLEVSLLGKANGVFQPRSRAYSVHLVGVFEHSGHRAGGVHGWDGRGDSHRAEGWLGPGEQSPAPRPHQCCPSVSVNGKQGHSSTPPRPLSGLTSEHMPRIETLSRKHSKGKEFRSLNSDLVLERFL